MGSEIVVALISTGGSVLVGVLALIGVVKSNQKSNREIDHKLELAQALTDNNIKELTREVREHNNFAKRVPVIETEIQVINHRVKDLEEYHK